MKGFLHVIRVCVWRRGRNSLEEETEGRTELGAELKRTSQGWSLLQPNSMGSAKGTRVHSF